MTSPLSDVRAAMKASLVAMDGVDDGMCIPHCVEQQVEAALIRLDEMEKPRPLRELIAEGHQQFWVFHQNDWHECRTTDFSTMVQPEDPCIEIFGSGMWRLKDTNNCPAIPIIKPASPPCVGGGK